MRPQTALRSPRDARDLARAVEAEIPNAGEASQDHDPRRRLGDRGPEETVSVAGGVDKEATTSPASLIPLSVVAVLPCGSYMVNVSVRLSKRMFLRFDSNEAHGRSARRFRNRFRVRRVVLLAFESQVLVTSPRDASRAKRSAAGKVAAFFPGGRYSGSRAALSGEAKPARTRSTSPPRSTPLGS